MCMSYKSEPLKGGDIGGFQIRTMLGGHKGDASSVDYSSYGFGFTV